MTSAGEWGSYPFDLMGGPARPPTAPAPKLLAMARRERAHQLETEGLEPVDNLLGAVPPNWQLAPSLAQLRNEANAANPHRDKTSDGTIGDARHQASGADSDHNAWLVWQGIPWCRALDIDTTGLDVAAAYERGRAKAAAGQLPQVIGGGYFIVAGRITAPDFSSWRTYKGTNPHILEGHVSVSTEGARFADTRPWGIFIPVVPGPVPAPAPAPPPAPAGPGWTGPDLRGAGLDLRGEQGANGVRTQRLQGWLRDTYPLYAKALAVDGWWGPKTSGVLAEFARRSSIRGADGANIGPQIARKLFVAGCRP